jgi:hypothetical protein
MRQQPPGRAGAELIEDGLNDPALPGFPRQPAGFRVGDQGLKNGPLIVRQIARIRLAALGSGHRRRIS